jgi:hypothetical protein
VKKFLTFGIAASKEHRFNVIFIEYVFRNFVFGFEFVVAILSCWLVETKLVSD